MKRKNISSGTLWEEKVGYDRAVRVGPTVYVSGTIAANKQGEVMGEDAYAQTIYIFKKIEAALKQVGASLNDVVRTRMYVTNLQDDWEGIARAHKEIFHTIRPASTMVEISKLMTPQFLIEIEVDAYILE